MLSPSSDLKVPILSTSSYYGKVKSDFVLLMLYSDEKTHAGFKTALDEVCQVVRPFPELSAVKDAMDVYKKRHGKEDQRKQQAGSRLVSLLVKTRQGSICLESYTSCSLCSKRFRAVSGQSERARNGIFGFGRTENGTRTKE